MYTGYTKKQKSLAISLYKKGKTLKYIHSIIGVSQGSLSEWLRDIPKTKKIGPPKGNIPWNKGKKHPSVIGNKFAFKKGKIKRPTTHYRARNLMRNVDDSCFVCGRNEKGFQRIVHHRDENPFNNKISNLQIVCRSCHLKIHRDKTQIAKNKSYERPPRKTRGTPNGGARNKRKN